MKILIVSGFLGAGKTTFIKELIHRSGIRPVVLENEYGDNSIDSRELRETVTDDKQEGKSLEILEFMEGCVCCTMKDSFMNSVLTVFSGLNPGYLIIEPTGVGRLSNIINNLKPILHDNITLLKPVVIVAPRSFKQNMNSFPELYTDQVAGAQIVIFSKSEHEDAALLYQTETEIRRINPHAEIVSKHYSGQDDAWWQSFLELPAQPVSLTGSEGNDADIDQITLKNAKLDNPAQLIFLLEDCLRGELGMVVRAKGFLPVGEEFLRFDLADSLYAVSGYPQETNECVFIGKALKHEELRRRMNCSPVMIHPPGNVRSRIRSFS